MAFRLWAFSRAQVPLVLDHGTQLKPFSLPASVLRSSLMALGIHWGWTYTMSPKQASQLTTQPSKLERRKATRASIHSYDFDCLSKRIWLWWVAFAIKSQARFADPRSIIDGGTRVLLLTSPHRARARFEAYQPRCTQEVRRSRRCED